MSLPAVQSLWIGNRLSAMGQLAIRSFLANGHDFHLYVYAPVSDVPAGTVIKDASEILPRDHVFAYSSGFGAGSFSGGSNYFRYQLLLDRGGWWVDTDVVCLRPFDFAAESVLASELRDPAEGGRITASSVIRQPRGSALMRWTLRACREKDPALVRWGEIGPRLLDEAVQTLGWQEDVSPARAFSPIPFFEWKMLVDAEHELPLGSGSYAVHLWHQMWRAGGVDPDATFAAACPYERLKERFSS